LQFLAHDLRAERARRLDFIESRQQTVKVLNEIAPPHFAVGDDIESRAFLIADGNRDGILKRFADVGVAEIAALFDTFGDDV
jgi:hypothetical protein